MSAFSLPHTARAKCGDHLALIATGMASHEHLATFGIGDGEARLAILMRRAARHPRATGFAPPRALAIISAFMAHLAIVRRGGRDGVIVAANFSCPCPFGENAEEAGDIERDLPGVLIGEVAPEARLPDLPGPGGLQADMIVVRSVRWFHRRPHGRLLAVPCSGLRPRIPTDDAGPHGICILSVPIAGIANRRRLSAALRPRGS